MIAAGIETLEMLTVDEVAAKLKVDRATVYRLIKKGSLEAVKIGRARRITHGALAEYFAGLRADARGAA